MKLTQEQLNQATTSIETHLLDIGLKNQFTLLSVTEKNDDLAIRIFTYEIANPTFRTIIQVEYDFSKDKDTTNSSASFSWMDYKKITE